LTGECIALSLFFFSYILSPLPAIGEKISNQKGFFSFCFEVFFTYRINAKNQKDIATEKGD
jgi:hypothetical protein